ncbi:PD-(D/E)XK nuclease-like domain-containing protein, partial [Endozoicomonas atrinae]|uniref:PD-(D/E)XK nuclease-like domain-containing protein n=1 Tax=Endozoicomonas atrinae TaxID=1333660 RepID=UPI0015868581
RLTHIIAERVSADKEVEMKPGIYDNLPEMDYHGGAGLSASTLVEMGRSPAHCKAKLDGLREKRTRALDLGQALHCAVLEPERF